MSRARGGFTLLEMMVALVIGGITLSAASALYLGMSTRADAIRATSLRVTRRANAERLLRLLAANVEPRGEDPGVRGDGRSLALGTTCETAFGWPEPCRVLLSFRADGRFQRLLLRRLPATDSSAAPVDAPEMVLRDSLRAGGFAYLIDASHGGSWSAGWTEAAPPPALAVVLDGDTLLLPVR